MDYSGALMSGKKYDKLGLVISCLLFLNLCGNRIQKHQKSRSYALASKRRLEITPFMSVHTKGDSSTGLYGDNKDTTFYKLQQDVEAKTLEVRLLKARLKVSEETKQDFFSNNI